MLSGMILMNRDDTHEKAREADFPGLRIRSLDG